MNAKNLRSCFAFLMLALVGSVPGQTAQTKPPDVSVQPEPAMSLPIPASRKARAQLTPEDLAAFLDGMLPTSMAIGDIAGAVVVVVQDGRILLKKGYGFADVARRIRISAERTLFRPASISKLFTWTAVMQQVEAGHLDLDRDINDYLDFRIVGYAGQPIRLRHLMTHTAGFEERIMDMAIDDVRQLPTLRAMLLESIPARIYPPGKIPAYSNYGAALAGYIVERVSAMPFETYVEQRIFKPLRMSYSTFRQPVPAPLQAQLSRDYLRASGDPLSFELIPDSPAGALSASGVDMAQFMLAHLNDGIVPGLGESSRVLQPATVKLMHSVANRPAPHVDAMALGFYEQNRNGLRVIAHGGDITAFHSDLILIPAAGVGLFMSFNSLGKENATYQVRTALFEGFMDRYFPRSVARERIPTAGASIERARIVTGTYELSRRAELNLFSFVYLLGQTRASMSANGELEIEALTALNGEPKKFAEIAPWLWREAAGESQVAAVRTASGAIGYLAADGYSPVFVFQPVPVWRDKRWVVPMLVVAMAVLSIAVLAWLINAIRRRMKRVPSSGPSGEKKQRFRSATRIASLLCLAFLLLAGAFVMLSSGESLWIYSLAATPFLRIIQLSGLLALVGAFIAVIAAVQSWRIRDARSSSLGRTLVAAACLACAYVVIAFHFLSLQLQY